MKKNTKLGLRMSVLCCFNFYCTRIHTGLWNQMKLQSSNQHKAVITIKMKFA